MKKFLLSVLIIASIQKLSAQLYSGFTDFDQSNELYITIDTSSGNLWQIGNPGKAYFNDAFSFPNAMVTDTLNVYPVNNTSVFEILMPFSFVGWGSELHFKHRYQTDSLHDGGYIEFSHDHGLTWNNVIADSPYAAQGGLIELFNFYTLSDTLSDGTPAFTGSSGTWQDAYINFGFFCVGPRDFSDTILARFVFRSDSVADNLDGWMIDDISIVEYVCSDISGVQNPFFDFSLYPNPAGDETFILLNKQLTQKATLEIRDVLGKILLQSEIPSGENNYQLDLSNFSRGIYEVTIYTSSGYYSKRLLKK